MKVETVVKRTLAAARLNNVTNVVGGALGVAVGFKLARSYEPTRRFMAGEPVDIANTWKQFSW